VVGDAGRIRQILLNLLVNAVKFTASGEIVVRLLEREREGSAVVLRGEVSDTGIGIPAKFQNLLFRPFSQVDSSDARLYGGTGLGLAIVKNTVRGLGGDVGVRSALGQGSTFWVKLRLL
jgi:signal transduction histidine kinase